MSPPALSSSADRAAVADVADSLLRLTRAFSRARARMIAAARHDVEWTAHLVLRHLHSDGPMRAGEIAESLQSDPSTISRQVAALVGDGLLERRADPQDGRASLLVLTERAQQVLADQNRVRIEHFAQVLDGWSDDELRDFADKLHRFNAAYEAPENDWLPARLHERDTHARSTT